MKKPFPGKCSPRGTVLVILLALFGLHLIDLSTLVTRNAWGFLLSITSDTSDIFSDSTNERNNLDLTTHNLTSGSSSMESRKKQEQQQVDEEGVHYTAAQQCRLELERWLNPQIDEFLQMGEEMPPLIDWVWDMGDHFVINMRFHPIFRWNYDAFYAATWNWQDQFGRNFTIDGMWGKHERWYGVVLPHFKVPSLNNSTDVTTNQTERSVPVYLWASNVQVPENKTVQHFVYDLRPYLKCDRIEIEMERPPPGTKIGMCVRFRGSHQLIPPFIAYHRLIGVEHFWFYANEEFDISDLPVAPYLTYVPYRFVWTEHKNYSRQTGKDGIERPWNLEYNGDNFWQVEAMQQCLYRMKRYGLTWLMTNDVDEYLWLTKTESMGNKSAGTTSVLQEFLLKYEKNMKIGGLAVEGWSFGANETEIGKMLELPIDYVHRANAVTGGRRKIIYRVPIAKRISVHWLYQGGKLKTLPISEMRWNHYRQPHSGVFQTQSKIFPIVRDSSLPDTYRSSIVEAVKRYIYPNSSNNGSRIWTASRTNAQSMH